MPDFNHGTMSSAAGVHESESPSASGTDCSSPSLSDELEGNSDDRDCSSPLLFDELDGNSDDSLMYPTDDNDSKASVTDGSEHSPSDPRVDIVPFYFYFGHENGPHLPQRVFFCMRDKRFTFAKHPELVAVLDPKITPIEYFHEDGTFRRLNPSKPLNCTYRTRLIIFRPGRQPRNYVSNCIGLRELSYELYLCRYQTGTPCTPIKLGIAPPDDSGGLKIAEYWEWACQYSTYGKADDMFARGNEYEWETGSDYESDTPQEKMPEPMLFRGHTPRRKQYNCIMKCMGVWYVPRGL